MAERPDRNLDVFDADSYYDSIEGVVGANGAVPSEDLAANLLGVPAEKKKPEGDNEASVSDPSDIPAEIAGLFNSNPTIGDHPEIQEADASYEEALLANFKKAFSQGILHLEKAYKIYLHNKHYLGAVKCLIELAWLKYSHDNTDEGIPKANRLLSEATKMINAHIYEHGMNEVRARMLHYQGLMRYNEKKYGEALKLFMQAKTFCSPNSLDAAKLMDSLAVHYERTNDFHRATQCGLAALELKKEIGILYEETISQQILGRIYILREEFDRASECLNNALVNSDALNDQKRIARLKNDLVRLHIYCGETNKALILIEDVIADCTRDSLRIPLAMAYFYKAYILFSTSDTEGALTILESEVLAVFKKFSYRKGYAMALRLFGSIKHTYGDHTTAIECMSEVIAIFKEDAHVDELAKTYFELGKVYVDLNEEKLALASHLEALKIAEMNDLGFIITYIEDEIFRLDENKWQEIVDTRDRHERVFDKAPSIEDALANLTQDESGNTENKKPSRSLLSLLRVAQAMTAERDLDKLLKIIRSETEQALSADRCTVFIYDKDTNELWSRVASGLGTSEEIRFPAHLGLAGYVTKTGEVLNITDAYCDPRFNQEIDRKTGYKTDTILCMPMRNRRMEIIGVFQVLNKSHDSFDKTDEDLLMAIATTAGVAIENASLSKELKISFESFVKTLSSTIDARDPITAGHSERVAEYSVLMGELMDLNNDEIEALKYASLLHDIGKIGIREDILKKDGRLTEKEYRHIQKHVYYTHEILKNVYFEHHLRTVPEIAASHHEKMDGSGYHRRLKGPEIPMSGRILALSDVFDAITSRRHYRNRMPFDKVLMILEKDSGTHFDPDIVASFLSLPLGRVGRILVMERTMEYDPAGLSLLKKLDADVTIGEYNTIMNKDQLSRGEADVHRIFNAIYHRTEIGNLD